MAEHGKRYQEAAKLVDRTRVYPVAEAVAIAKQTPNAQFDASVEEHLRLGVDPRHADQMVRGTVVLPHGTGKIVRVAVFAQGEKAQEALRAGADDVGSEDLVKKIEAGWLAFTFDLDRAIREVKAGRVEFKVDKGAIIHVPVGKTSFAETQLVENLASLVDAVNRAKPSGAKGQDLRTLTIATTMGPGIRVDIPSVLAAANA